jgi:hypothetical protein
MSNNLKSALVMALCGLPVVLFMRNFISTKLTEFQSMVGFGLSIIIFGVMFCVTKVSLIENK